MVIDDKLNAEDLKDKLDYFWSLSGKKILRIESEFDKKSGSPVITMNGKYTSRGWTEWTQGFQFGSAILQFDATGDESFLTIGRENTVHRMAHHISHTGVHDHGFNNISTFGNLLRLMLEGKIPVNHWEKNFYELAIKTSGAVQANRWSTTLDGGYIYSFNGPHSLFVDTIRSVRILMMAHKLGHSLPGENDIRISLFSRGLSHLLATAKYSVFYDEKRDSYDEWGRTAHESIFNPKDGSFRCPNSQQGYSGFSTWTRGLGWAMLGFTEELEFLDLIPDIEFEDNSKSFVISQILRAAKATCDFYIKNTPADGIPYWDSAAPGLDHLKNYLHGFADPYNDFEPVDSSAAAIGAQGLLRLGHYLMSKGEKSEGAYYFQAGLTVASRLLGYPYLSEDLQHQGILLHSIYHRPNGWDHIPIGHKIPCNESSMWGDYHIRETALYLSRLITNGKYYTFFSEIV